MDPDYSSQQTARNRRGDMEVEMLPLLAYRRRPVHLPPRRSGRARLRALILAAVALVNGDPITALDVARRTKLIQMSTQKLPTRQEVLEELIDDKLKVHIGKR